MNKPSIRYCDSCKRRGDIVRSKLAPRLKKEFPNAEFDVQCLSFCGPGSRQPFVYLGDTLIYAATDDALIDKIRMELDKLTEQE